MVASGQRPDPSPEEIRRLCALIRAEWDEQTELSRRVAGFRRIAWVVPGADRNAEIVDAETADELAGDW